MIEPMPCPACRALVIPPAGLDEPWYDYIDAGRHGTCGPVHVCPGFTSRPGYICPRCGTVSHHPDDILNRYCGSCHLFADDVATGRPRDG